MGISAEDYGAFKHHLGATLEKFKISVVDSIGQAGASTWRFTPQMYTLKLNYPHRAESHRYLVARPGRSHLGANRYARSAGQSQPVKLSVGIIGVSVTAPPAAAKEFVAMLDGLQTFVVVPIAVATPLTR